MGCTTSYMSCTSEKPKVKDHRIFVDRFNAPQAPIQENEILLVKKTWRYLSKDISGTGHKIFKAIFKIHPEVKELFHYTDDIESLISHPELKGHAARFMQAIGAAVDNIDDLEKGMTTLLIDLGKQHIHFTGFKPEYFESFYEAIIQVWKDILGSRLTMDCADAWSRVMIFMMEKLKDGYQLAMLEQVTIGNGVVTGHVKELND